MYEKIYSLIYKKYSLKAVKRQLILQLLLVLFICILSLIKFKINDDYITLSFYEILVITPYLFIMGGLINASVEVESPESKIAYLLHGNRNKCTYNIIIAELLDCLFQTILSFIVIIVFFFFIGTTKDFNSLLLITFILSTVLCFFISYCLTLYLNSSMSALAILLIFPLLVLPYIERVFPLILPYIYYEAISESFTKSEISTSHIILLFWNLLLLILTYLKVKKRIQNG